jgi:hypothetical protein
LGKLCRSKARTMRFPVSFRWSAGPESSSPLTSSLAPREARGDLPRPESAAFYTVDFEGEVHLLREETLEVVNQPTRARQDRNR